MKQLIDEIKSRIDVLNVMLEEYGRSEVFAGSRPQALFKQELQVLTDALKELKTIFYNWGNSNYTEDKNCDE